jgi:nicotinate-nucleotide pyrophosphorylase
MTDPRTDHLIDLALEEDAGLGDVTSRAIFRASHRSRGFIAAGHDLVVCGLDVAAQVFARVDPALKVQLVARDGDRMEEADRDFFERVAKGYFAIAAAEPARVKTLDAAGGVEEVRADIWKLIEPALKR